MVTTIRANGGRLWHLGFFLIVMWLRPGPTGDLGPVRRAARSKPTLPFATVAQEIRYAVTRV